MRLFHFLKGEHKIFLIMFFSILPLIQNSIASDAILITNQISQENISKYMEILEDPQGLLTVNDIRSSEFDTRFVQNINEVPNYGHTASAYWVRFKIIHDVNFHETMPLIIELGFANMQYIDFYQFSGDSALQKQIHNGMMRKLESLDPL